MNSTYEQIKEFERQLKSYPNGYISRKVINGKERFYLQWTENNNLKGKYIKSDEVDSIRIMVEKRRQLEHLCYHILLCVIVWRDIHPYYFEM